MFNIMKEPAHDKVSSSPLTIVKVEPSTIKKEPGASVNQNTDSDYGTSSSDCPITNVKAEILDDATLSEDEGSVGPDCSSYTHAVTKQELDIGPTQLQPPDIHYRLPPCKPDPDSYKPLRIIEDRLEAQELQVLKKEDFPQQPDNDQLMQYSRGSLPHGMCAPTSQHIQRVKIESQSADTDASNQINPIIELLASTSGDSSLILPQDATHRDNIYSPTSNVHGDIPCNRVSSMNYSCQYCRKVFSRKSNLLSHMQVSKHYFCNNTQLSQQKIGSKVNSALIKHNMKVHIDEKPFACKFCDKRFSKNASLTEHLQVHTDEKPFECKSCEKRFKRRSTLTSHLRVHTGDKPFECKSCGRRFNENASLTKHLRVHTGEKPFECKSCGKRFRESSNLAKHLRVHTGEKPFECKSCGKRFAQSIFLTEHLRVHTGEKPFECKSCGKRFTQRSSLTYHLRVHTDEKPFECKFCEKRFTRRSILTIHLRVHTGEKPFECKSCGKRFIENASLTEHLRVHTGEKPFKCKSCEKRFKHRSALTKHLQVHTA